MKKMGFEKDFDTNNKLTYDESQLFYGSKQVPLTTEKKEKKYLISKKNPWLNPKDNFGKLERGKVE